MVVNSSLTNSEATISEKNETVKDLPLTVSIAFGDIKTEFSGSPEAVLQSVNSFLAKAIPELSLAKKTDCELQSSGDSGSFPRVH